MKKILLIGIKFFKLSAWFVSILTLIVTFLVVFLITFPAFIKTPIENKLSELSHSEVKLSNLNFGFEQGHLFLQIEDLQVNTLQQKTAIASVNNLKWGVRISALLHDVYHSNNIFIDTLILYPSQEYSDSINILKSFLMQNLAMFDFIETVNIDKTLIKKNQVFKIAPILLSRIKGQTLLQITGQNLDFGLLDSPTPKMDIKLDLSNIQFDDKRALTLPILINNADSSINAKVKFFNQQGDDFMIVEVDLEQIPANKLVDYWPSHLIGDDVYTWIKRGFIAGNLGNLKLRVRKNLSQSSAIKTQFDAELRQMELLFNSDWEPLKKLNASLSTDGKKITVMVHNTLLNGMPLNDIKVQIDDLSKNKLDVQVNGDIHTQSEQLLAFLKRTPLDKEVHQTLHQFNLSGKVDGTMQLLIPLDERASILDIDLSLKDNHLAVLDGAVVVKNYNSKLALHNDEITAIGVGDIRGSPFDIRINPSDKANDNESSFLVELVNNSGFKTYIAKQFDQSWRGRVESDLVKGNVAVFLNEEDIPTVRLSNVQVATLDAIKGDWNITPQDFPSMYLSAKDVYIDEDILPNFSTKLISKDNRLVIHNLKFEGVDAGNEALNFQGFWEAEKTELTASAESDSLSDFLKKLKIKEKVTGGKFIFKVNLFCKCAPWNMSYRNVTGALNMNVDKGVFTDKDPNLGRILSLININSIVKRLKLDATDVTNKGFTYENIEAKIVLQDAIAKIEYFNINALSSDIVLTGQGDLLKEQYDLTAKVIPAVSDSVPVATYLAGGGLIGLGVWAVDKTLFDGKIIHSIVDKVAEFKYKITGPWNKPVIKPL